MKTNKGFAPIAVVLVVIVILIIGGVAYYVKTYNTPTQTLHALTYAECVEKTKLPCMHEFVGDFGQDWVPSPFMSKTECDAVNGGGSYECIIPPGTFSQDRWIPAADLQRANQNSENKPIPEENGKTSGSPIKTPNEKEVKTTDVVIVSSLPKADTSAEDIKNFHDLFLKNNIAEDSRLILKSINRDLGTHLSFYEQVNGVSTDVVAINYHFDTTGKFTSISGGPDLVPKDINTNPKISASQAVSIATNKSKYAYKTSYKQAQLIIREDRQSVRNGPVGSQDYTTKQSWNLAWKITPLNAEFPQVQIDAVTGEILYEDDGIRY